MKQFCICLGLLSLFLGGGWQISIAQTFIGESKAVPMNFGYPKLQVLDDVTFVDEDDDDLLSAGEAMLISFSIQNQGKYPAVEVRVVPKELNNLSGLDIPYEVEIGKIPPGETREIQIGIASEMNLPDGTASFVFRIEENGTFENISVPYVVSTKAKVAGKE